MSNFALLATDPTGDIISSINYLLATQGQTEANANLANALIANATTGTITTSNDPSYLAYLYQYINVRYADSADGSVNFSTSPTNRLYYGVRNSAASAASSNPADYIWTQVAGGGFGTTNFLYYATNGGRQIQWYVGTAPLGSNFVITTDAQYIDLDVLSASLVNTTLQIIYSDGQVFNKNTANVWSPNAVANIISTTANISAIRNNVVIAAIGQTISYNAAAQTWSSTTNPSPNVNPNSFSFGTLVSSTSNYYQPVSYVDTYANLLIAESVTVVTSGANGAPGANGANGINGISVSTTYNAGPYYIQANSGAWTPVANATGYVSSNVVIQAIQGNSVIGQITRTVIYNAASPFVANPSTPVMGGNISATYSNTAVVNGNVIISLKGLNGASDGIITVSNASVTANILVVGGGNFGQRIASGWASTQPDGPGDGGQVKYYSGVTFPVGTAYYRAGYGGGNNGSSNAGVWTYNVGGESNVRIGANSYTAAGGTGWGLNSYYGVPTPYGAAANAGAISQTSGNLDGANGVTSPWPLSSSLLPTNRINHTSGNVTYLGGGGAAVSIGSTSTYGVGGLGGGGDPISGGANWNPEFGYGGGGGSVHLTAGLQGGEQGIAYISYPALRQIDYDTIWQITGNSVTDINANLFTITSANLNPLSASWNVTYSNTVVVGNTSVSFAAFPTNPGTQGNRGFVPLAYVLTSSDPTSYSTGQYTYAFQAPRTNVATPIGTGYSPIDGDTAQFAWVANANVTVSVFKTYDGTNWSNVDGQVIDGNVLVSGTVTASKLAANDIYALTIQSTSATVGANTSPGFWLQANTGNARFGGGMNVGDSLVVGNTATIGSNLTVGANANIGGNLVVGNNATIGSDLIVGANANIGANLYVTGLITTGNLNNNTVNTTTIISNAISDFGGNFSASDLIRIHPVANTFYNISGNVTITSDVANTKVAIFSQSVETFSVNISNIGGDFVTNTVIRVLENSTGVAYILNSLEVTLTPFTTGNLQSIQEQYYLTGFTTTLPNAGSYTFATYNKYSLTDSANANVFASDFNNRGILVQALKR